MSESASQPIRTPDQRLWVFVSSTLQEAADERKAAREAIEQIHLAPVMFERGATEALRVLIDSAMAPQARVEYDQVLLTLHTQWGERKFKQLWDAGRVMNMEQAIVYALNANEKTV